MQFQWWISRSYTLQVIGGEAVDIGNDVPQSSVRNDAAAHLIGSLNYNAEAPPIVSCIENTRIRDYDTEDQAESRSKYCDVQQFLRDRKS